MTFICGRVYVRVIKFSVEKDGRTQRDNGIKEKDRRDEGERLYKIVDDGCFE